MPTDLEPRSSIGEGGKLSHLVRTSFVVGTSQSMPTAGEEVENALGREVRNGLESRGRGRTGRAVLGEPVNIRGGTSVSHLRLRLVTAVAALVALSSAGGALAAPTDVFFSEYIEGIEQQQGARDLQRHGRADRIWQRRGYSVQMFFNGSATRRSHDQPHRHRGQRRRLRRRPVGAGPAILAQADQTNALGLVQRRRCRRRFARAATVLDMIGQIGFDPGTEWGTGLTSTGTTRCGARR